MKLVARSISLLAISICIAACSTNTIIDSYFFPSEYTSQKITDDSQTLAMCFALEGRGYQFDEFYLGESQVKVTYSDGQQKSYLESQSMFLVALISTSRDFANPEIYSDEEFNRIKLEGEKLCTDYGQIAEQFGINLPLKGVFFWDYLNGVRGGFGLSAECEIIDIYGWGAGSYASRYEIQSEAMCPSGRVIY